MRCTHARGCHQSFDPSDPPYNCCVVTATLAEMKARDWVRVDAEQNPIVWGSGAAFELAPVDFRGSFRSRHRVELVQGMFAPWWAAIIARAKTRFSDLVRIRILRAMASDDSFCDEAVAVLRMGNENGNHDEALTAIWAWLQEARENGGPTA